MQIVNKNINDIYPYENNPRNNENAVEYVAKSIENYGFKVPVVIDRGGTIVAGHTRWLASKQLGLKEVPCIIADDLNEKQIKEFRLVDNKVAEYATWDINKLDIELADLDLDSYGFDFITDDDYGTDFELPEGDKSDMCQITFYLHEEQKSLIEYAMSIVADEVYETFGNLNKAGNEIYEVVRQWAEQRK